MKLDITLRIIDPPGESEFEHELLLRLDQANRALAAIAHALKKPREPDRIIVRFGAPEPEK